MPFPKYHGNLQHFFSSPNELIHKDVKSLFFGETLEKNQQKALEKEKKNLKTFLGYLKVID